MHGIDQFVEHCNIPISIRAIGDFIACGLWFVLCVVCPVRALCAIPPVHALVSRLTVALPSNKDLVHIQKATIDVTARIGVLKDIA
jgi:hypothetical protein